MSLQLSNVNGKKKVELLCNMLLVKFNYLTSFFSVLKCYRITQKIVTESFKTGGECSAQLQETVSVSKQ